MAHSTGADSADLMEGSSGSFQKSILVGGLIVGGYVVRDIFKFVI